MKTIEQAVTDAAAIYMPKGKEVALCTEFLEGMGFEPPQLNDDAPEGIDSSGRLYSRVRAKDGVKLLASGNGPDNAVAFAGTDVCEELIAADPGTNLEYAEFGTDSTCTYDLLLPKNAPESIVQNDADVIIPSGLERGGGREFVLVMACDAVIAISGGSGTINELSVAYQADIPMVALTGFGGWADELADRYFDGRNRRKVIAARTPEEAVEIAFKEAEEYRKKYA